MKAMHKTLVRSKAEIAKAPIYKQLVSQQPNASLLVRAYLPTVRSIQAKRLSPTQLPDSDQGCNG